MNLTDKLAPQAFMAFAKAASGQVLDSAEYQLLAEVVGQLGVAGAESGFPGGPTGDAQGWNQMRRTNWFNGRHLTAEALKRQDVYFDLRDRLGAQAQMPGVAWGLGLRGARVNRTPLFWDGDDREQLFRRDAHPADAELELSRGLAFDHVGRPILVSQAFRFTLEQLIGTYRKTPQRVVETGTQFVPCVCLAPDPAGPTGGSALLPSGPYLLIIQAAERPQGGAKVMGVPCGSTSGETCAADFWQGGFGLSLARLPVNLAQAGDPRSVWDLRGTLSAWYFDVFEHPLWSRWDHPFATDAGFCQPSGPGRHDAGAVALAMLYLAEDGSALFIDQWIPRRTICATPAEDWHRTRFGAPPRAAAWARIHQFQCMLSESLALEPLTAGDDHRPKLVGLHRRGFRHIPPIGFLPIPPQPRDDDGKELDERDYLVSASVERAEKAAKAYFQGTNVVTYTVVAYHDDDILEDLANVFDKDPVQLTEPPWSLQAIGAALAKAWVPRAEGAHHRPAAGITAKKELDWQALAHLVVDIIRVFGTEELVNRRTEIVKIVVPLEGLSRRHPVLGLVAEDTAGHTEHWGVLNKAEAQAKLAQWSTKLGDQTLGPPPFGLEVLPRQSAVYVKQRLVVHKVLFQVLDVIELALKRTAWTEGYWQRQAAQPAAEVADFQEFQKMRPFREDLSAGVAVMTPVYTSLVGSLDSTLGVPAYNRLVVDRFEALDLELAGAYPDPAERREVALERAIAGVSADTEDFRVLGVFAGALGPEATLGLVRAVADSGAAPSRPVGAAIAGEAPVTATDPATLTLVREASRNLAARPVRELVPDANVDMRTKDVLALSEGEAREVLGEAGYAAFVTAYTKERSAAITAGEALSGGVPDSLLTKIDGEIAAGRTAEEALAALESDPAAAALDGARMDGLRTFVRITGGDTAAIRRVTRTGRF
jgi:hypothetical protein